MNFAALIASNKGRMVAALTAIIMGGLTQLITTRGMQMPQDIALAISGMIAALAGWLIDNAAARINTAGVTQMQDAMPGVLSDGYAGPKTIDAARENSDTSGAPAAHEFSSLALNVKEGKVIKEDIYEISRRYPSIAAALRKAAAEIRGDL